MACPNSKPVQALCYNQQVNRTVWGINFRNGIYGNGQHKRIASTESIGKIDEDNIDVPCSGVLLYLGYLSTRLLWIFEIPAQYIRIEESAHQNNSTLEFFRF
jgi:hypothetical protein